MRIPSRLVLMSAVAGFYAVVATPAYAQDDQPELRYVTTTSFTIPLGDDFGTVMAWVDSVMVPSARMNPNVLSYRVAVHNWGNRSGDVVIITEFPSWAAITAPCEACDEWAEMTQPAEKWPDALAAFQKYYSGHSDEIYIANMARAKN